jgi:hypothetical protein
VDPLEIELERAQERLARQESDPGGDVAQMTDTIVDLLVLDGGPDPDMLRDRPTPEEALIPLPEPPGPRGALRQDLVDVAIDLEHDLEGPPEEVLRDIGVEKIRHGVHEDDPRIPPPPRLRQPIGPEANGERVLSVLRGVYNG